MITLKYRSLYPIFQGDHDELPRLAYKPRSVLPEGMGDHLSRLAVTRQLVQPTRNREADRLYHSPLARQLDGLCLALLPAGVTQPRTLLQRWWSLTPPFHPYLCRFRPSAVCLCGPILRLTTHRTLSGAASYGVRTFLDPSRDRGRPASLGRWMIT